MELLIKLLKKIILINLFLAPCYSQIEPGAVRAYIGEKADLPFLFISSNYHADDTLTFDILIEKPNIFYPEKIRFDKYSETFNLTRVSDSLYRANINLYGFYTVDSLKFYLKGEILATNDSVSKIYIKNCKFNGEAFKDTFGIVNLLNRLPNQYYYRQLEFEKNYPNPVSVGETTVWNYHADLSQELKVYLYDINGKVFRQETIQTPSAGTFQYKFKVEEESPCGFYYIKVISDFGSYCQPFVVIK